MSTADLLEQWREATRAAQLAERLAELAKASVERCDRDAVTAREIAKMAERAAKHAERAAHAAREAANRASAFADENRSVRLADADSIATDSRTEEEAARERFHEAERNARERHESGQT